MRLCRAHPYLGSHAKEAIGSERSFAAAVKAAAVGRRRTPNVALCYHPLLTKMFQRSHRALYAAFDRFPSRKGAAIHIDRFARTLFDSFGGGVLAVLGAPGLPLHQVEGSCE